MTTDTAARLTEAAGGQRRMHRIEKRYLRKDGSVIWADVSTLFVPATGSTPPFFSAVIVDITERKLAEEALRESEQRLHRLRDASQNARSNSCGPKIFCATARHFCAKASSASARPFAPARPSSRFRG